MSHPPTGQPTITINNQNDPPFPPMLPPTATAMMVSQAEQDHIDAMRLRYYHLAIERGHIRR